MATLDAITRKYEARGKHVEVVGLNEPSQRWHDLSGNLGASH